MKNLVLAPLALLASVSTVTYADSFVPGTTYATSFNGNAQKFTRDGAPLAELMRERDDTLRFSTEGKVLAEVRSSRDSSAYPRKVVVEARTDREMVALSYVEVAPALPIQAEASDEGLSAYAADFERETGRKLKLGYEISGRVRDGVLAINGEKVAAFYAGYQRNHKDGSYKEHHRGDTLEQADVMLSSSGRKFVAYRCGCWGFSEYDPRVVVGGYEYSVELKSNGDWINIGKGKLFRKPRRFIIRDVAGEAFGGIDIDYTGETMDSAVYRFYAGKTEFARAYVEGMSTRLVFAKEAGTYGLQKLDTLLALLPTQVLRGDGVRDSRLGQVETLVDWLRFAQAPAADTLSDVVSKTDAATAADKAVKLLSGYEDRFKAKRSPDEAPPGVVCTPTGCKYVPEARP